MMQSQFQGETTQSLFQYSKWHSILDDIESIWHSHAIQIDAQSNAKSISTLMDLENSLLESQHLPTIAYMAKTRDIHYQESTPPLTHPPEVICCIFILNNPGISWGISSSLLKSIQRRGRDFLNQSKGTYKKCNEFRHHEPQFLSSRGKEDYYYWKRPLTSLSLSRRSTPVQEDGLQAHSGC